MITNNVKDQIDGNIKESVINDIADRMQFRSRKMANGISDDLYLSLQDLGYNVSNSQSMKSWNRELNKRSTKSMQEKIFQNMLKDYVVQHQMIVREQIKNQIRELNLSPTPNSNYMINKDGQYFRFCQDEFISAPQVITINSDGTYIAKKILKESKDCLIITYDMDDRPIRIKIVNGDNKVYKVEAYVAKKLKLKKEYVKPYKLHGYSGNSSGYVAALKNWISKPKPSGWYLHDSYNFFKWNFKDYQFESKIRQGRSPGAPMMSDYDIREDIVVRTDYDGAGILL